MMRVVLTRKAEDFLARLLPGHFQRMAALMDPLTKEERRTLVTLLDKILQNASTLNTEAAASPASAR
jgi:DNA-binding MarR family transcriptional regulator